MERQSQGHCTTVSQSVSQSVCFDIKPHPRSLTRDAETWYIGLMMAVRVGLVGLCGRAVELVLSTGKGPWPAVYLTVGARVSRAMVPSSWIKQCFLSPTLTSPCKVSWLGSILQLHSLWRWWLQRTPKLWHSNVKHGYSKDEITWTSSLKMCEAKCRRSNEYPDLKLCILLYINNLQDMCGWMLYKCYTLMDM